MGAYTASKDKVDLAEKVMKDLSEVRDKKGKQSMVTTSQIRRFLTAVNTVTGKVEQYQNETGKADKLTPELAAQVKFLKVKLAYQVGRGDVKIKSFAREADLMAAIDSIGEDAKKYEEFARYVEALVAFHKYYGGKD
jgi:CRISPR-associated protein Csm2